MGEMLTQELAKQVWTYDPETGDVDYTVAWASLPNFQPRKLNRKPGGDGYIPIYVPPEFIPVAGVGMILTHRLGFLILEGWLPQFIDHRDGDRANNVFSNLREATRHQNGYNRKLGRDNTSGYKGVTFFKGRWRALIRADSQRIFLGDFDTPEEAAQAYDEAAIRYHGEFAKTNQMLQEVGVVSAPRWRSEGGCIDLRKTPLGALPHEWTRIAQ